MSDIDVGLAAALITDIRKLEDAADKLAEIRRGEQVPNKKVILDIAIKIIREETDKIVLELLEILKEHGRLRNLPEASTRAKEEVPVPAYPKEVVTETDGA